MNSVRLGKVWLARYVPVQQGDEKTSIIQKLSGVHRWIWTKHKRSAFLQGRVVLLHYCWGQHECIVISHDSQEYLLCGVSMVMTEGCITRSGSRHRGPNYRC